jgi:hypothetical protein
MNRLAPFVLAAAAGLVFPSKPPKKPDLLRALLAPPPLASLGIPPPPLPIPGGDASP